VPMKEPVAGQVMTSATTFWGSPRAWRAMCRLIPALLAAMAWSIHALAQAPDDTVNAWRVIGDPLTARTFRSTIGQRLWVFTCNALDCRATPDSTRSAYYAFLVPRSGLITIEEWQDRAQAITTHAMRPGLWRVVEASRSAMTGDSLIAVSVRATGRLRRPYLGSPELVIRCRERQLELYVVVNAILGSSGASYDGASVRLRFDNEQATSHSWSRSSDGRAAFADEPEWVIMRIMTADTLRVEYQPYDAIAEVATFRVAGVGRHLPRIARACPGYLLPLLPGATGGRRRGGDGPSERDHEGGPAAPR